MYLCYLQVAQLSFSLTAVALVTIATAYIGNSNMRKKLYIGKRIHRAMRMLYGLKRHFISLSKSPLVWDESTDTNPYG